MAISFSFKNNAQYVKIDGRLASVEEAAIRLKLDQKINQGRLKILVDIALFDIADKDSVKSLQSIAKFASNRGTAVGIYGIKQTSWVKVADNFSEKMNLFETEAEALKWIEKVEVGPKPPPTKDEEPPKKDAEAEIKEKNLKELLAKYEIYQAQNDYDPYLLRKLEQEYAQKPSRDPLFALRRAYKNLSSLKDAISQIDAHCRTLADQLLEATTIRKIPLSPAELAVKKKAIQDVRSTVEAEVNEVKSQVDSYMAQAVDYRRKMQAQEDKWKIELDVLQKQIEHQQQENKKILVQIQGTE